MFYYCLNDSCWESMKVGMHKRAEQWIHMEKDAYI